MKKILMAIIIVSLSATATFAQPVDLNQLETQFEDMGKALGSAIPSTGTNGLLWSDAYIGNFPHFGVGAFVGATMVPSDSFGDVLKVVSPGAALPSQIVDMGIPVPSLGLEGRIGGFVLPFDVGLKFAMINYSANDVTLNYSLIGFDVRYAIIKDGPWPKVSAGLGFSRLTTNITMAGLLEGDIQILDAQGPVPALYLKNPDMEYGWTSNIIEIKAQVSKSLLLITPYIGTNIAYSMTNVGGGVKTRVVDSSGNPISQTDIDTATAAAGVPGVKTDGFETFIDTSAWAFKIYGGTSINIFILKLDLSVNYDLLGKTYGGQVGFRLQF